MDKPGKAEDFKPDEQLEERGAVDLFDQQGEDQPGGQEEDAEGPMGAGQMPDQASGQAPPSLMEQWLQQVEGNPAYLIRNQFMLEEQRMMSGRGAPLHEPRPW